MTTESTDERGAEMCYTVDCWNCGGEGYLEGECTCGEDCCCCADPEPPTCDVCRGKGYLIVETLTDDTCETAIPVHRERPDVGRHG